MSDIAIRIENLSKQYRLGEFERYRTLRESLQRVAGNAWRRLRGMSPSSQQKGDCPPQSSCPPQSPDAPPSENGNGAFDAPDTIWALRDVSFEVPQGQVLGIIGRNGAGKSTLLKILSRITEPTTGSVEIHGRVSSLLEVGTGFHPELTGRENIFVNGAILGMTRAEIRRKFDEIVDFAGVEKFLDTPVKRYSSGMSVRLAFAVAAHLEPEILIVDEVLAVGDAGFQNKCIRKMEDVAHQGRTVLFVSHNMVAVESLCTHAVVLRSGVVETQGSPGDAVRHYVASTTASCGEVTPTYGKQHRSDSKGIIEEFVLRDTDGNPCRSVRLGDDLTFDIQLVSPDRVPGLTVAIFLCSNAGQSVVVCSTKHQYPGTLDLDYQLALSCTLRNVRVAPGLYTVSLDVRSGQSSLERVDFRHCLEVLASDIYGTGRLPDSRFCAYLPDADWKIGEAFVRSGLVE